MGCKRCGLLERELASLEADFLARSRDYHESLNMVATERNALWAQLRQFERRGPHRAPPEEVIDSLDQILETATDEAGGRRRGPRRRLPAAGRTAQKAASR